MKICGRNVFSIVMKSRQRILKSFDSSKYGDLIARFNERMIGKEFEQACEPLVYDILQHHEGFERVERAPDVRGRPFDFFGYKQGLPYIIEVKNSLKRFHAPGELQKQCLQEILQRIPGLHIALLQIKLRTGEYRILCDKEISFLFQTNYVSLDPILDWLKARSRTQ